MKNLFLAIALVAASPALAQSTNERCGDLWSKMQETYNQMITGTESPSWEELDEAGFNLQARGLVWSIVGDNLFGGKHPDLARTHMRAKQTFDALSCEW